MKTKIKTHRVGDTKYNNFGSKIIISKIKVGYPTQM